MKFTQIPTNTFENLQINAGILIKGSDGFNPATGTIKTEQMLGATSGGINITCVPSFVDFGENVDNCPKNTMELKKLENWECKIAGSFVTVNPSLAKMMLGASDIDSLDTTKITPRVDLSVDDFSDVWFVGDYSDKNGATNGGFVAIHLLNALNTSGFSLQTSDKEKGTFAVEFTGHVSMNALDVTPMVFYIKSGTDEVPVTYEYVAAELTDGFVYGVTYYTRSGSVGQYVYTEVEAGASYDSQTTYYIKQVAS